MQAQYFYTDLLELFYRGLPDGVETDIIATIKKTFNFSQSDAIHLFQTLMECMKSKELVNLLFSYTL